MKEYLKIALLSFLGLGLIVSAKAQNKKKKDVNDEAKTEIPQPPPPQEELKEAKISLLPINEKEQGLSRRLPDIPAPFIDFDTTSAPNDEFTQDILQLLEVTNAMNFGQVFANGIAKPEEQNELLKEFYKRFFIDLKEGSSYRWMKNLYIKVYRQKYTREEVRELVKFYQSPLGKKVIKETMEMLPAIMKEGEKIGKYLGTKIMNEILSEQKDN